MRDILACNIRNIKVKVKTAKTTKGSHDSELDPFAKVLFRSFSSVQSLCRIWLFATPWTVASQASITNSLSILKLMSIELVMPSNHLILCHPLLLPPSIFPGIRVFSSELLLCIRWPKYWSFNFSISPSSEYSGLISFRMDWLDLLAVHGTLKSLLQPTPHFKSTSSSALSFPYSPTLTYTHEYWKNDSLDSTDLFWQSNVCFLICCLGWS